ncbi:hypothetical protein ACFV0R_12420, partial [Streptomyces sp. NPDC059578]
MSTEQTRRTATSDDAAEAVHRTLVEGPADLTGPDVPGIVYGCLRQDPQCPSLDETFADRRPVHADVIDPTPSPPAVVAGT